MRHKLFITCQVLMGVFGNNNWFLPTPITVRTSPIDVFEIHGLCVSPQKQLFIMDGNGEWNKLELSDENAEAMVNAIHERVTKVFHSKVKEVA